MHSRMSEYISQQTDELGNQPFGTNKSEDQPGFLLDSFQCSSIPSLSSTTTLPSSQLSPDEPEPPMHFDAQLGSPVGREVDSKVYRDGEDEYR